MELKTQALDRVLEALSPALAAELDRVVNETRQSLEQEFQKRLQTAVRDAENAVKTTAEVEMRRAVDETREATQKKVSNELEQQFKKTLEKETNQLQSEASAERTRLQEQLHQWRVFAETQRQLGDAASQPEILARFLKLAEPFASKLAVYVSKADGLALWKSRGKPAFPEIISEETTDPESYFRTINVRGKTVAAVSAAPPFKAEALDFLGSSLERAIEVFGLKLRAPSPLKNPATSAQSPSFPAEKTVAAPTEPAADDPKLHADARRTARLIVSEIKLYHEQELREGREKSDIYDRLRKEIDVAREMYTHRVSKAVLGHRDYFHEELVRILGENEPARLGAAYPGPLNS